jgi:hypothetical protein
VFRSVFSLVIGLLLLAACQDIPRDNWRDPQNPDSYQLPTILLEAFVNTSNPLPYNQWALQALDSISAVFGSRILIAEYHRNASQYSDPYSNPLVFEPLYTRYVENSSSPVKGVPDIFINGTAHRVQGASGISSVITRLNDILSGLTILNSHFTLEQGEVRLTASELTAACKIARLGNQPAENLLLRMILVRQINSGELKRVAQDVQKSTVISRLEAGEIRIISFDPITFSEKPDRIIFSLTTADELTVLQSTEVNL